MPAGKPTTPPSPSPCRNKKKESHIHLRIEGGASDHKQKGPLVLVRDPPGVSFFGCNNLLVLSRNRKNIKGPHRPVPDKSPLDLGPQRTSKRCHLGASSKGAFGFSCFKGNKGDSTQFRPEIYPFGHVSRKDGPLSCGWLITKSADHNTSSD